MIFVCHSFKFPHSADDAVASSKLFISQICGAEEGLFPTFGPCFINFYGAPREFETMALGENNLDHLNMGKGVGCAYRGRALIEIEGHPTHYSPGPDAA